MDVNSSFVAYATPADLVECYDSRVIGDLIGDANQRENVAAIQSSTVVARALKVASGEIEYAVTCGKRYTPADLLAFYVNEVIPTDQGGNGVLTGTTVACEMLKSLCCDLAFWWLTKRRHPEKQLMDVEAARIAHETLDKLRMGERIFPFLETQGAGLPEVVSTDPGRTVGEYRSMTSQATRFFGTASARDNY